MQSIQALRGSSFFLVFLGGLIALGPLSIDAYMPALPDMALYFGVEIAAVNLTLTTYLLGGALGQFFGGALSDHLGRRPVGLVGLLLFATASLLIPAATDIGQVWALRALQALGAGAAAVVCMAQVRDVYPPNQVPKKIANVTLVMLVAPMLAPSIGAALMQLGWKSVFYFLAAYTGFCLLVYFFYLPETNAEGRKALTAATLLGSYRAVLRHRVRGKPVAQRITAFSACGFYMSLFDENAGSAAALSATLIFMVGALFGALAAVLSTDGLTPIFLVMLTAGILARLALPPPADAPANPNQRQGLSVR